MFLKKISILHQSNQLTPKTENNNLAFNKEKNELKF